MPPKLVYLDHNATTRTDPAVVAAMLPLFSEVFGNPSSPHVFGEAAAELIRSARAKVSRLLGAAFDHEIVFTSGGTESNNTALDSALGACEGRDEIVTTAVEHSAVLTVCKHLEEEHGARVRVVPVDSLGRIDLDAYRAALGPRTAIASAMWVNNETGTLFPIEQLAKLAHEAGALFHTDAVQAVGRIPIALASSKIDLLSLSGHKLHGPKGIGVLYVRKGVRLRPLLHGGRQERARRGGTENTPGIVGLGKAAELAAARLDADQAALSSLRDRLEEGLLARVPGTTVVGDRAHRVANTSMLTFDFVDSEALLLELSRAGIAASSGAACASGSYGPSHVLRAMNVPFTAATGAVRFSLARENDEADIERVLELVPRLVASLREGPRRAARGAA